MKHTRLLTNFLSINDDCRARAHLKHEIKVSFCHLKRLLHEQNAIKKQRKPILLVSQRLCHLYEAYLAHLVPEDNPDGRASSFEEFPQYWEACYQKISLLQRQWFELDESIITQRLHRLYLHFVVLLEAQKPHENKQAMCDVSHWLSICLQKWSPVQWLETILLIINQQKNLKFEQYQTALMRIEDSQLRQLAIFLNQEDVKELIWTVFFYRMNPEQLFEQIPHPEKLVSVKNRLNVFYDAIRNVYLFFTEQLLQRGLPRIDDYLFQEAFFPSGTEIHKNEAYRAAILSALKSIHSHVLAQETAADNELIQDLFRAYKYWFNPNRLIDAVMSLKEQCLQACSEPSKRWELQLVQYLQKLTTCECIELYGYFANKDTCYLMKTFIAIEKAHAMDWQYEWHETAKKTLFGVYEALELVMASLREVLHTRQIKTKPYKRRIAQKIISPGRRNREAILRVLDIYQSSEQQTNPKIESLFSAIEDA